MERRKFLAFGAAAALGAALAPRSLLAATAPRILTLHNAHSNETCRVEYFIDGWYNPDALAEVNYILRDWRTDEEIEIDPGLLDILHALQQETGDKTIEVVCGYRSPRTNAMLASTRSGVAKNSLHMTGQAADIYVPDVDLSRLRDLALDLSRGGVGYYPRSNFIHVDTGPVRTW